MQELLNAIGLTPLVGYEYVFQILVGCLAIIIITEMFGWLKVISLGLLRGF